MTELAYTTRTVSVEEGLRLAGIQVSSKGAARGTALIQLGAIRSKHYAIRRRARDGQTRYRWGQIVGAEVTRYAGSPYPLVVFIPERAL